MASIPDWIRGVPGHAQRHPGTAAAWLDAYICEVNRRAESAMLKGGKIEGAHRAAMLAVSKEFNEWMKAIPL